MPDSSITDWIGAIATAIAGFGALGAWFTAQRQLVVARRQAKDAKDNFDKLDAERTAERAKANTAKVRVQADLVAAWIGRVAEPPDPMWGQEKPIAHNMLQIKNGSTMPVFDVRVTLTDGVLPNPLRALGPGVTSYGREYNADVLHMTFRDSANRWWRRSADGNLTQLDGKPQEPKPDPASP